jgi:hypothetical protein
MFEPNDRVCVDGKARITTSAVRGSSAKLYLLMIDLGPTRVSVGSLEEMLEYSLPTGDLSFWLFVI